jgi:nitrite reductase (NADH) large subunit
MKACGARSKTGVVVGGGLLGLECAKALRDMGLETHVVEFAPRLMAVQVDEGGGRALRHSIEALGLHVHTGRSTVEIVDGATARHRMVFADGTWLETDMIVFSAGIRPRDELARQCVLALGARGGVAVDNHCRTSDRDVYAIGECASWNDQTFGLVAPGYDMARVAAKHIAGQQDAAFTGADMSTKLKLMGVDVASIGDAHGKTPKSRAYQYINEHKQIYKKIVVSEDGQQLLGAVLVGDATEYGTLLQIALNGIALPAEPEFLILPSSEGKAKPGIGVEALPDTAQICSCNSVSKGQICEAVGAGTCTIAAMKACNKAGASCGGCVPLVTQIMKMEMAKRGMAVNNHLCEHFPYSRQELYHLVRVGEIKTFADLLSKHGKGLGCDVCKPTAASILASCWNDFVLKNDLASLQDSNDYFLGNIQKDGSYSVVPRMPGGEVTADGLIAVGQVAKKYGLYTKITGGARVDLFGLYVCGNGGMKPRHAELIATSLTKPELVKLIDRFLMFYVRTADRLQRTSTWRDNLEGGLDYLKGVLLQDTLGLGAALEAQMQHVVDTYQCEWKTAVNDPATRQRFRSFVNSEKKDEHIVFVEERGQIRPARAEEREEATA